MLNIETFISYLQTIFDMTSKMQKQPTILVSEWLVWKKMLLKTV